MNRSIAKTRNQLQRITFKINQLKTKYTGDNYNGTLTGVENSPVSHYRDRQPRQPMGSALHNKFTPDSRRNSMTIVGNGQDAQQKQMKTFRNEIYAYIDKCMQASSEREGEALERAIQSQLVSARAKDKNRNSIEDRIKKIEEETTSCLATIQDAMVQITKNDKGINDKLYHVETKLRKEMAELGRKLQGADGLQARIDELEGLGGRLAELEGLEARITELEGFQGRLAEFQGLQARMGELKGLEGRITELESRFGRIQQKDDGERLDQLKQKLSQRMCEMIAEEKERSQSTSTELDKLISEQSRQIQQLKVRVQSIGAITAPSPPKQQQNLMHEQLRLQIIAHTDEAISKLTQQLTTHSLDLSTINTSLLSLQSTTKQLMTVDAGLTTLIQAHHSKIDTLDSRQSRFQKISQAKCQQLAVQLAQSIQDSLTSSIKYSIETSYLKPRLEQVRREMVVKVKEEVEVARDGLMVDVEELVQGKISRVEKQKRSPKTDIEDSRVSEEKMKEMELNLRQFVIEEIQQALSREKIKITDEVEHKLEQRSCQLSSSCPASLKEPETETTAQSKKVQQLIEEKLGEFENDINETIKLLYEDIENKVTDMIGQSGIMELKAQLEGVKNQLSQIHSPLEQNQQGFNPEVTGQFLGSFREQIYNQMGGQIHKISSILERTVEQMELKVEKLDNNFAYVYERMSKIEYDNANFKDKLTSLLPSQSQRNSPAKPQGHEYKSQHKSSNSGNLLDMLGQYSTGKLFFEGS